MNEGVRKVLYSNHGAKMLLHHMLREKKELLPEYEPDTGFRYPLAEQYIGSSFSEAQHVIRKLYEAGVLLKKYRDKAVACPSCLSPAISVKYLCPSCNSSNIEKKDVCEHVSCGFVDSDEVFVKDKGRICPKCGKTIDDAGVRRVGTAFHCRICGESFEKPTWMHFCKKCRLNFTLNEASFIDVYSYVLNCDVKDEFGLDALSVSPIKDVFEKYSFKTSIPGSLKGISGSIYLFDLVAKGKIGGRDVVVALDITCSTGQLDPSSVSSFMGKLIDADVKMGVLIAIPEMDPMAKNLAELYDIMVVESKTSSEAAERIDGALKAML